LTTLQAFKAIYFAPKNVQGNLKLIENATDFFAQKKFSNDFFNFEFVINTKN